jgi:iron complex outermembrane receptor protein
MPRPSRSAALCGLLYLVNPLDPVRAQAPAPARAVEFGTVTGRVSNAATGSYLEGAQVAVQGTRWTAVTDQEGRYTIRAEAGDATLVFTYLGLTPQSLRVTFSAGSAGLKNVALTSDVYKMESFVVEGEREGSSRAITRQRLAPNVKNVVATDLYGSLTEDNIGSFLEKLPGLNVTNNVGKTRDVMVRGIDSSLNTVEMDGVQLASTNSSGTSRSFDFLQASISMVESIEVTKAPTPDMPASSIGGSINLVTRTAFGRTNPRMFNYSVGFLHAIDRIGGRAESQKRWFEEPIEKLTPAFSFSYSDLLGSARRLGVTLNYSRTTSFSSQQGANFNYQATLGQPAYIRSTEISLAGASGPDTRQNLHLKLEYKLSDRAVLSVSASNNFYLEGTHTRGHAFATADAAARFAPGYSETRSEALPNVATTASMTDTAYDLTNDTYRYQAAVVHKLDRLIIDYSATLSLAEAYPNFAPFERKYSKGRPKGTLTIGGLANIGWIIDRSRDGAWPLVTQTAGRDAYDLNSYQTLTMTQNHNGAESSITEGRFNVKRGLDLAIPAFIKTGLQFQRQQRKRNIRPHSYTFIGPGGLGQFADKSSWISDRIDGQRQAPWVDMLYVAQHKEDNPQSWPEDLSYKYVQRLRNQQDFRETIASGYIMANGQIGALGLLAGLRFEETRTLGNGPLNRTVNAAEAARRAAFAGPLTEEEIKRRAEYEWGTRVRSEGQYQDVFPGVHFKYTHRSGFIGRASYSTSIGRPSISSIIPNTAVNEGAQRITVANTGLKPQHADNFDVTLEYYFEPVGLFTAGVFLKEVSDFIFTDTSQTVGSGSNNGFDGLYEGYSITTSANGGHARYRGFELSYQQQFVFLPGFWSGFGINLNYTQLSTRGDYGTPIATTQVAGFRPRTANIALSYKKRRYDVRLQTNWVDTYLQTASTNAALILYESPKVTTSAKITFAATPKTSVYLNWDNIFGEPSSNIWRGVEGRVARIRSVYPTIAAGIQGRF